MAHRSAFFFHGHLQPAELANFNVQNVQLRDRRGGTMEVLGNGIAVWWPSRPRADFDDLADAARAWFRATASSYYLETAVPLDVQLDGWVEALDVVASEAVIGFSDPRFIKVPAPKVGAGVNTDLGKSIDVARAVRRAGGEIERAISELLAAANDGTPQSFLSAYRALECVRRLYAPAWNDRKKGWQDMSADLAFSRGADFTLLEKSAQAVRHGNVPATQSASHVVNDARKRRPDLLNFTRNTIRAAVERHA